MKSLLIPFRQERALCTHFRKITVSKNFQNLLGNLDSPYLLFLTGFKGSYSYDFSKLALPITEEQSLQRYLKNGNSGL